MKRNTFTIALILVWGFISSFDSAANGKELTKQQKKELRKEKKILRKAENEKYNKMMHANACQALQDLDFVLEAGKEEIRLMYQVI
jgi:3-hydroxyacyl-CoA dehydrogenase